MKHVALIAPLRNWNPSYSVVSIVQSHIRSMVEAGYSPRVLTLEGCEPWAYPEQVDYRSCMPNDHFDLENSKLDAGFRSMVARATKVLERNLEGVEVVVTHDIMYHHQNLMRNLAIRRVAKQNRALRWLHWCHSSPNTGYRKDKRRTIRDAYQPMNQALFICPSPNHLSDLAKMYGTTLKSVRTVPNARITPEYLGFDPRTKLVIDAGDLWPADVIAVFPTQISRPGKQPIFCIYLMAALKAEGQAVRLVFTNNSAGPQDAASEQASLLILLWVAKALGLTETEVIFTSDLGGEFANYCPPEVIRDLFRLSNVFIHPSLSETGSLTLMEAAAGNNLCVLNKDVQAFHILADKYAMWITCESVVSELQTRYGTEEDDSNSFENYVRYYRDRRSVFRKTARQIIKALHGEKALMLATRIRRTYNERTIFSSKIQPLLEGPW